MVRRYLWLVALCIAPPGAACIRAQETPAASSAPRARPGPRTRDSTDALGDARAAQREFEQVRRRHLPQTFVSFASGCQERVGRLCWFEDDDTTDAVPKEPPAESPRIIAARERLLARLDTAAAIIPGDDWITGQQVLYLLEAGRAPEALARARRCAPSRWWCDALIGLALHASGEFAPADSAFAVAVGAMPEAERCHWTDLTRLLDGELREAYSRKTCAERLADNDRLWWLADPLHARPGNDRRTEHYSRLTRDHAQARAMTPHRMVWGKDIGELTVRYGWASHYAQDTPRIGQSESSVVGYHRTPGYRFFPDSTALGLESAEPSSWTLRPRWSVERYSPLYSTFAPLAAQTAAFHRGDSLLVAVAYDVGADTLFGDGPIEAALVLTAGPAARDSATTVIVDAPRRGRIVAQTPRDPVLASIEIIGTNRVRRMRAGVSRRPPVADAVRLSDLAFFEPWDSLPASFAEFLPRMRLTGAAQRDERLGLYWELSGEAATVRRLETRVEIVREGRHWLRRAGERIGLFSPDPGVQLRWDETMPQTGRVVSRSVVVDLAGLDPGTYRIELVVQHPGGNPVVASRMLRVGR